MLLHLGGIGDLVLFSASLASLRAHCPDVRIMLAVREAVAPLANAAPIRRSVDRIVSVPIDPYRTTAPSPELFAALEKTFDALVRHRPHTLVSAELRPTWLTWALAARLRPARALTLRGTRYSRLLVEAVCERFGLEFPVFERYADGRANVHELERYGRLLGALGAGAPAVPRWNAPARATRTVRERGLVPRGYVVCFPCGAASTPLKRWPPERFLAVLTRLRARHGLGVVVVGDESERGALETFAANAVRSRLDPAVFVGSSASFDELRAVLSAARAFLGNDTGLAHLAAVHGVPGVTVYGGGTWPMYGPWAVGTVGVLHPLPCFGCFWDCAFGRGICVEQIPASTVAGALEEALAEPLAAPRVVEVTTLSAETKRVIHDAATRHRALQAGRAAHLEALVLPATKSRASMAKDQTERELAELRSIAEERARFLELANDALSKVTAEADRRSELIEELSAAIDHNRNELDALSVALAQRDGLLEGVQHAADERLASMLAADETLSRARAEIERLQALLAQRDAEVVSLRVIADERLLGMHAMQGEIVRLQAELGQRQALLEELQRVAGERLVALNATDAALTAMRAEAEARAQVLAEMSGVLDRQDEEIARLRAGV